MINRIKYWLGIGIFWAEYPDGERSVDMSKRRALALAEIFGGMVYNE